MQEGYNGGGPQEVDVSFNEDALEFFELSAGVGGATKAGLGGLLLERGIEGSVYLEFPVGGWGEVDVHGKGSRGVVLISVGRGDGVFGLTHLTVLLISIMCSFNNQKSLI